MQARVARVLRLLRGPALFLAGAAAGVVALYLALERRGEQPRFWHRWQPESEFRAGGAGAPADLARYRAQEDALFDETRRQFAARAPALPALSRFDPRSPTYPGRMDRDWNRTFELLPAGEPSPAGAPRGEALLLHGLSDSPYSMRALGELLRVQGYHVVGLRLPGHGAVPAGLAAVTRRDWREAVQIGVASTGARANGRPFVLAGYSNGAALALDYTLRALEDGSAPVPTRLVFLSPAFAVTPAAALAGWRVRIARLPGLAKLAWSPIEPEVDPFKFNSFPVAAGAELARLTRELERALARLETARPERRLPPVLTLQSVVDATVPPAASLSRLYDRVDRAGGRSELVLFDVNRRAEIATLLDPEADALLRLAAPGRTFPFRVTLVTNAGAGTSEVVMRSREPGTLAETVAPLGLAWPRDLYSLSHVAIPFPPDDPVYGAGPPLAGTPFPFGALALKGERGVLRLPATLLTRLRYNPFFAVVEARVVAFLGDEPE